MSTGVALFFAFFHTGGGGRRGVRVSEVALLQEGSSPWLKNRNLITFTKSVTQHILEFRHKHYEVEQGVKNRSDGFRLRFWALQQESDSSGVGVMKQLLSFLFLIITGQTPSLF